MHYADFAEDDVQTPSPVRISQLLSLPSDPLSKKADRELLTLESGTVERDQRIRCEQVESDWPKGGQTGQGTSTCESCIRLGGCMLYSVTLAELL